MISVKAHGHTPVTHSPEAKRKISEALRGNQNALGHRLSRKSREKMRQAQLGKKHSPEVREKIRQSNLGKRRSAATRERIRQAQVGRKHSPTTKEKIRQFRLSRSFPQKMTGLERSLHSEFRKRRLRFEMHKTMFHRFQPDFVFEDVRLIVQADGDYWHRIRKDRRGDGDARFNSLAREAGWTVWRFAESEIKQHPEACGRAVARFVRSH